MIAASVAAPQLASAHGPTRQKVTESVEINAPAAKVWAVVGNFQDMSWDDNVASTTGKDGNTPNKATRVVTLKSGGTLTQDLTRYQPDQMRYGYFTDAVDVKVLPVNDYSGTIQVEADGADKSKVTWDAAFYRGFMNNEPPPELNDDAAVKAVTKAVDAALASLKKKVEAAR
ncbi:MAG TPA: SRPBCC family protein [Methylovirgula sp.]